jgi:hypothetical protein
LAGYRHDRARHYKLRATMAAAIEAFIEAQAGKAMAFIEWAPTTNGSRLDGGTAVKFG